MKNNASFEILILILLLLTYGFILAHKIDLTTADLGRHIKNGEILLQDWNFDVIKTNFYSYTEPEFPVVNHHWLSGIIFFIVWKLAGLSGVHLFFIALSLATFLIFFKIAQRKIGAALAAILSLVAIPLLAERTEIRPEAFSYLFSGLFIWALLKFQENKISFKKLLLILLPIQIIWVNTHIFFFLGLAVAGTFIFQNHKKVIQLLVLLALVSLANPFGVWGLLEPFKILNEYGYSLAENQTVWFLENYGIWRPNFEIFKFSLVLVIASFVLLAIKRKFNLHLLQNLFLTAGISAMAIVQSRNIALFGFFLMPVVAQNFENLKLNTFEKFKTEINYLAVFLCFFAFFLLLSTNIILYFPYWKNFGIGIEKNNSTSVEFFKKNNLSGPIFNNYDIGSYLIFHLYPEEKVFVDNRPEAYSVDFFENIYKPAQENMKEWEKLNKKYGFKTIIFSHRDLTPWGQSFLKARINDPVWKKVFVDEKIIIFQKPVD